MCVKSEHQISCVNQKKILYDFYLEEMQRKGETQQEQNGCIRLLQLIAPAPPKFNYDPKTWIWMSGFGGSADRGRQIMLVQLLVTQNWKIALKKWATLTKETSRGMHHRLKNSDREKSFLCRLYVLWLQILMLLRIQFCVTSRTALVARTMRDILMKVFH